MWLHCCLRYDILEEFRDAQYKGRQRLLDKAYARYAMMAAAKNAGGAPTVLELARSVCNDGYIIHAVGVDVIRCPDCGGELEKRVGVTRLIHRGICAPRRKGSV